MKEVEKNEIKRLSDRLDAIRHQQADLSLVEAADKYAELEKEKETLEAEIARLREVHSQKLSKEAQKLTKLPFRRAITKKEQADMGKLKKSVRGLIVVHSYHRLSRHPSYSGCLESIGLYSEFFPINIYTAYIQVHF